MKISQQLRGAAIGIFVIGSSSLLSVYLNSQGNDGKVVNYTGIVRGGSQRLIKLELAGSPSNGLIEKQDKLVDALINGNAQMGLPPATDREFRLLMQQVATDWQNLKQKIEVTRKNTNLRADLLATSERYFELTDRAVSAAEKFTRDKADRLAAMQLVVFVSSFLLLIIIWMTVNKIVKILRQSTERIANAYDRISMVLKEQEQSVTQQSLATGKAIESIDKIEELTKQSTKTIQLASDRFEPVAASLQQTQKDNGLNLITNTDLHTKLQTIVTHLDLLDRQVVKFAKVATPTQILVTTAVGDPNNSQAKTGMALDRAVNTAEEINKLFDNLQSSIAAMKATATDSLQMTDIQIGSSKDIASALQHALNNINALSVNNQQMLTTAKEYNRAVERVSSLIDRLNSGASHTTASISQIRTSASELGETTAELQSQI